jgi:cullin-associated NEDD8-dissociated protein 1
LVRPFLIQSISYTSGIPPALAPALISQVKIYLTTADISLLSQALIVVTLLLELTPKATFPEVERDLLSDIYSIAHSPLVSGAALDSLLGFFSALVRADNQISTHLVPNLVISVEKAPKAEASSANVAKCVAQVVQSQQNVAAGVIAEYSKNLKVWPPLPDLHKANRNEPEIFESETIVGGVKPAYHWRAWSIHVCRPFRL